MARTKFEKLPEEIIVEILSRLPAKLIGQSRCVSKQWCSILSAPQLIKAHLIFHSHKYEEEKLITVCDYQSLHTLTFNQDGNGVVSRKLDFHQQLSDNWVTVGGSCNGLVLAVNEKLIAFLTNPTTLEYHRIPDSGLPPIGIRGCRMYGLGYDVRRDDYKVVTFSYYATGIDGIDNTNIFNTSVAVYSVRKGLWRKLLQSKESLWGRLYSNDCAVPDCASGVSVRRDLYWTAPNRSRCESDGVFVRANGVLVNGDLHWLVSEGSDYSPVIVAFDILEEKFFEVPGPTTIDKGKHVVSKLVALRGCLSILCETIEDHYVKKKNAIWTMKDYGIEESWTKYEFEGPELAELIPLCLMSEDDIVLATCGSLIVSNRREDQWWDIRDDRTPVMLNGAGTRTFRESLVPPTF